MNMNPPPIVPFWNPGKTATYNPKIEKTTQIIINSVREAFDHYKTIAELEFSKQNRRTRALLNGALKLIQLLGAIGTKKLEKL